MKSVCLLLITAVCLSTMVLGCRKKNEDPAKIASNITRILFNSNAVEITYNKDDYPTLIKYGRSNVNFSNSLEIIYKENKIEKLIIVRNDGTSTVKSDLTVSYPKENEVNILDQYNYKRVLIFDKELLSEVTIFDSSEKMNYMEKNFYNSESNLIRIESYELGAIKDKTFYLYQNYDKSPNPFFAKAKIWAIIAYNSRFAFDDYMPLRISKNNPRTEAQEYAFGSTGRKTVYEYNSSGFPSLLTYSYTSKSIVSPIEERPFPVPGDYQEFPDKTSIFY